jgi:hypothetical protein
MKAARRGHLFRTNLVRPKAWVTEVKTQYALLWFSTV